MVAKSPSRRRLRQAVPQGERWGDQFRKQTLLPDLWPRRGAKGAEDQGWFSFPLLSLLRIFAAAVSGTFRGSHLALAIVATAVLGGGLSAHAEEDTRPPVLREVGLDQKLGGQIPLDVAFRDEAGQAVTLQQYFGKRPVILVLAYYQCPMLCTLVLNGLTSALRTLSFDIGQQFEVVTVSIDPADTPALATAKKQTYLDSYRRPGADAGWHFLTGDAASIDRLAQAVGFRYRYDPVRKEFAHAAGIMVLTPGGTLARYFYGVEFAPRDLRFGLIEAAENRIGSPVDQLLLYCYQYDPSTGHYSAAVMNIVRLGGVLTVGAFVVFLLAMRRRDLAQRRPARAIG